MRGYPKKISIIIPVYNESGRIQTGLAVIAKWHREQPKWEFILVNDGSTDDTVKQIKKYNFIKLISYANNQGKGYALKQGVLAAKQPLILISDIDWSTPLTELPKLFQKITTADLVIGSRKMIGSQVIIHQLWWREWLGKQFTNLTNIWLELNISDFTCGFKLLKLETAKKLFGLVKINHWGYDAELLYLAKKLNFKVAEVPILWKNDEQTKVSLVKDVFSSLIDLWKIKFNQYEI